MVLQQLFQLPVAVAHVAKGKVTRPDKLHLRQPLGDLGKLHDALSGLQLAGADHGKPLRIQAPLAAQLLFALLIHLGKALGRDVVWDVGDLFRVDSVGRQLWNKARVDGNQMVHALIKLNEVGIKHLAEKARNM